MKIGTKRYITLQLTLEEADALSKAISYGKRDLGVNSRAYEIANYIEDGLDGILSDLEENK
ncbi:TPA: hypothetical protein ACSVZR_003483 [Bacillus cereus]